MKRTHKKLLSLVLSAAMLLTSIPAVPVRAAENPALKPLKLQYNSPANKGSNERNNWERWALPLGNGHMGAMVFGRTDTERIQMNEKTLWTGGTGGADNAPGGEYERRDPLSDAYGNVDAQTNGAMDKYIDYLFDLYYDNGRGGSSPAQSGDMKLLPNNRSAIGDYQNFAEMYLDFNHPTAETSNYRRELDLRTALSTVTYDYDGVTYTREMFADHPDNVMVYRVTADKPGSIDMVLRPEIPDLGTTSGGHSKKVTKEGTVIADEASKTVTMQGNIVNNNMKFAGLFRVENEGGTVTAQNPEVDKFPQSKGQLTITDADSVVIYVTLGTNYKNVFPDYRQDDADYAMKNVTSRMEAADEKGYDALLANHLEDYQELFSRNELNLGGTYDENEETDQLLSKWKSASASGTQNHYLEELYYQYGRYMMIASTREDTLPSNLQGIWNDRAFPDWQSDYHTNINLQMNYWPAFNTDLAECGYSLVDYVDSLQEPGALTAEKLYGTEDAWMVNCSANALGFTGNINSSASLASTANAFILQNVYDYYKFTQDKEMLESKIYPMMTGASNFFLQILKEGRTEADKDKLFMAPSFSSEQGPWTIGAAFDQQLIYLLFKDTLEAAKELGVDNEFTKQVADAMEHLYPVAIGESGQIKEWQQEGEYNKNKYTGGNLGDAHHRHNSQLMVLHPGNIVTTENEELMKAAETTLNLRGDGATGWSMGQKFNMWARLQDGNHAYDKLFVNLMKNGTATNLFDLHPPFQIDGNFGGTAGIVELLMQSHAGYVSILPALPDKLANGYVKGLVAEGNFGVDITWADKAITELQLTSRSGNRLALKAGVVAQIIDMTTGKAVTDITQDASGAISFDTEKDHVYKVIPGTAVDLTAVETLVKEAENVIPYANTTETGNEFEEAFLACKRMVEQGNYVASDVEKTTARLTDAVENLVERDADGYGVAIALKFLENAAEVSYMGTAVEDQWRQQIEYARADLMEALLAGNADTETADKLVKTANKLAAYPSERIQLFDLIKTAKGLDQGSRTDEEWKAYHSEIAKIVQVFVNVNATAEELTAAYDALAALVANMETVFYVTASSEGNGTVSPSGKVAVLGGASQKFTVTPAEGYEILDVCLNGKSVGAVTEYTVSNLSADAKLTASFQKAAKAEKSEAELLLNNAIAKAKQLDEKDYATGWDGVTEALAVAEAADRTNEAGMKEAADALLDAIDALTKWSDPIRREAESSELWPVENYDQAAVYKDQANWGDKTLSEKLYGGYPDNGPTGPNSGGSPDGQWAKQQVTNPDVSGQWQMFSKTNGTWVKFNFEGNRVRYITEKATGGADVAVYIDGKLIDTVQCWVTSGNPRNTVGFDSADYDLTAKGVDLSKTTHELKLVCVGKPSGQKTPIFRVDAFDEYDTVAVASTKALAELIAKASALDETAYTAASWAAMQEALTAAKDVLYSSEADQAAVNAAKDELQQKINELKLGTASEKLEAETLLKNAIARAEKLDSADYTKASWDVVASALEEARAVLDGNELTMREKANALLEAMDALKSWGESTKVEAESFNTLPFADCDPNDSENWGEKDFDDPNYTGNEKLIAGYPESGPENKAWGTWGIHSDPRHSSGNSLYVRTNGTWLKYKFQGERIRYWESGFGEGSMLEFYIDDQLIETIDSAVMTDKAPRILFDSEESGVELDDGEHILKIVAVRNSEIKPSGRQNFKPDAFEEYPNIAGVVSTKALAAVIADASSRSEVFYTAASWAAMQEALTAAKEVLGNLAASQEEVDAAAADLQEKLDALQAADPVIVDVTEPYPVTVPFGTTAEELEAKLPTTVVVKTASIKKRIDVNWNTESFDGTKAGTVTLEGELIIPEDAGINNNDNLKAKVDVIIEKGTASIILGNLEQKDDNITAVTAVTNPEGLTVTILYDGVEALPTEAGTYEVMATVVDDNYEGTATGTLVIHKTWSEIEPGEPANQYTVTVDGGTIKGTEETFGIYEYNKAVTVTANETDRFAGWEVDGKIVSKNPEYKFYVSGDITLTAVYDEEKEMEAEAILTNVIKTDRGDGKYNAKFVVQLVVPEGCELEEAGLVWSNKGKDDPDVLTLPNAENKVAGVKVTKISKISNTWQYSVTINGVPNSVTVPGRAFAVMTNIDGQPVYSEIEYANKLN